MGAEPAGLRTVLDDPGRMVQDAPDPDTLSALIAFLGDPNPDRQLLVWFGRETLETAGSRDALLGLLQHDIARLDEYLNSLLNTVLHHPVFQKLEARWRGLSYLTFQPYPRERVVLRVFDVSWKELAADARAAIEFDQSVAFRKLYEDEFGTPGGTPFGLLLGDYEIAHRPGDGDPDPLPTLRSVAGVAAAAFAPLVMTASPRLLNLDDFGQMGRGINLQRTFQEEQYTEWMSFRRSEDARFVGLCLPRLLMRQPYRNALGRTHGFIFNERVAEDGMQGYLWGSAVFAFGAVAIRAFCRSGWFEDISGLRPDDSGGMVPEWPVPAESTDPAVATFATEIVLSDAMERELAEHGFITLNRNRLTSRFAVLAAPSLHAPQAYRMAEATQNEALSSQFNLVLSVSRFAHCLKVIGRQLIGVQTNTAEVENALNRWLNQYVTGDPGTSIAQRARYPLRSSRVRITESQHAPGSMMCTVHLVPHPQTYRSAVSLEFRTRLRPAAALLADG